VGEALEQLLCDAPEQANGLLARHFEAAHEPARAANYLLRAGDAARAVDSEQEAVHHYRRALAVLRRIGDERRAHDTLLKIGLTHHLAFEYEAADRAYAEAFAHRPVETVSPTPSEQIETIGGTPDALTPGHAGTSDGMDFVSHLFAGLLAVDPELNIVPALAAGLRVSADGLVYRIHLRPDACWSDGAPVVAGDFCEAWERGAAEPTGANFLLDVVAGARALDERTLEVRLDRPLAHFPYLLASPQLFPWPRHVLERLGERWREPRNLVSNGPFRLAEYDAAHALLVANPHWPLARGNVARVRIAVDFPFDALRAAWAAGRFDLIAVRQHIRVAERIVPAPDTASGSMPALQTLLLLFDSAAPPFDDVRVRRAFAHSIDRAQIAEACGDMPATRGGVIPPSMTAHSHDVGLPYDAELARELLAAAGHPDGRGLPDITLTGLRTVSPTHAVDVVAEQWRRLGASVTTHYLPSGSDLPVHFHAYIFGWNADYPDPDTFMRGPLAGTPLGRTKRTDALLEEAAVSLDRRARAQIYGDIERIWVTELAAIVPLSYGRFTFVRRTWVEEFQPAPLVGVPFHRIVIRR
jgi:oligopeptide transport system substrate-binding protein